MGWHATCSAVGMAANFLVILVELDRGARAQALRDGVARFVVLGTLSLVVLAQLCFVVTLFWPYSGGCGRNRTAAMNDVMGVVKAVEQFQLVNQNRCPQDLDELVTAGIMRRAQKDPWGRPFTFKCSAAGFRVCSLGRSELDAIDNVCSDDR